MKSEVEVSPGSGIAESGSPRADNGNPGEPVCLDLLVVAFWETVLVLLIYFGFETCQTPNRAKSEVHLYSFSTALSCIQDAKSHKMTLAVIRWQMQHGEVAMASICGVHGLTFWWRAYTSQSRFLNEARGEPSRRTRRKRQCTDKEAEQQFTVMDYAMPPNLSHELR